MSRIIAKCVLLLPGLTLGVKAPKPTHNMNPIGPSALEYVPPGDMTPGQWAGWNLKRVLWDASNAQGHGDLSQVHRRWRSDAHVVMAFVKRNGHNLQHADLKLRENEPIVLAAMKKTWSSLAYAAEALKSDGRFMLQAMKQNLDLRLLLYAAPELRQDRNFTLQAMKLNIRALYYAVPKLPEDPGFTLQAMMQDIHALHYAGDLCLNLNFMLQAVQINGHALQFAMHRLRSNPTLVLMAVKQNGFALQYALREGSSYPKADRMIVLEALGQQAKAWRDADEEERLKIFAGVLEHGTALKYAAWALRGNPAFMLDAIDVYGFALRDALPQLLPDTIRQNPMAMASKLAAKELLQQNIDFEESKSHEKEEYGTEINEKGGDMEGIGKRIAPEGPRLDQTTQKNYFGVRAQLTDANWESESI